MDESRKIEITFTKDEHQIYELFLQYCEKNGSSVSDTIKSLIKRELGWGQFAKRKRKDNDL